MRRLFSCILILALALLMFASCEKNPSHISVDDNKIFNVNEYVCETPTRIIYNLDCELYYYNKLDGGVYTFCFDPVCKHGSDCISQKFQSLTSWQTILYREEDNRLYALRGKNFLTMNFDGSDVKILYTFGENDWDDSMYKGTVLKYLQLCDEYAYMLVQNEDSGNYELYRYNIDKGNMDNLMGNAAQINSVDRYKTNGEEIYFWSLNGESNGFYKANMDLTQIQKLSDDNGSYYSPESIFDGKTFYIPVYETIDGQTFTQELRKYDVEKQKEELLCELNAEGYAYIYSVTDRYLYYSVNHGVVIGQRKNAIGNVYDIKNYHPSVQRLDMETGEIQTVFYDLNYEILGMCLMEDAVLLSGNVFEKLGNNITSDSYMMIANIDENGNFVNIRVLEKS